MTVWVKSSINDYWVNIDKIDFITIEHYMQDVYRVLVSVCRDRIVLNETDNREDAMEFVRQFVRQMEVRAILDKD